MSVSTILTAILFGFGLAMDACAVAVANGLNNRFLSTKKIVFIAVIFALFQAGMPATSYFCGKIIEPYLAPYIPNLSLAILAGVGLNMIFESTNHEIKDTKKLSFALILVQAVATSIDALSVGFSIVGYSLFDALVTFLFIAVITFFMSFFGAILGKKSGKHLGNNAQVVGGIILISIGVELFITSII